MNASIIRTELSVRNTRVLDFQFKDDRGRRSLRFERAEVRTQLKERFPR